MISPSQSLLTSGLDGRPSSSLHCLPRVHHPHAADANAPVCAAGATTPEARSWGWRTGGVVWICPEGRSA